MSLKLNKIKTITFKKTFYFKNVCFLDFELCMKNIFKSY